MASLPKLPKLFDSRGLRGLEDLGARVREWTSGAQDLLDAMRRRHYGSDEIKNESSVSGSSVSNALDAVLAAIPATGVRQITYDQVTTDVNTTAVAPGTALLTRNITTVAGSTLIIFGTCTMSCGTATRSPALSLAINGTAVKGSASFMSTVNGTVPVTLFHVATGLSAGSNTVRLDWYTVTPAGSPTLSCNAATLAYHGASLVVVEV